MSYNHTSTIEHFDSVIILLSFVMFPSLLWIFRRDPNLRPIQLDLNFLETSALRFWHHHRDKYGSD